MNQVADTDMLYTVREVAKICKTDVSTIYKAIKAGEIVTLKIGRTKISSEALRNYIKKKEAESQVQEIKIM